MRAPHQLSMKRLFLASVRHIPLLHGGGPDTPELLKSTEYYSGGSDKSTAQYQHRPEERVSNRLEIRQERFQDTLSGRRVWEFPWPPAA